MDPSLIANIKQKAIDAVAPNATFEPGSFFPWASAIFFMVSVALIWLMIKAGKGKNYGDQSMTLRALTQLQEQLYEW